MAHGGRRPGAGRKPGAATKKVREAADRLAAEGLTPLDYMLGVLRGTMAYDAQRFAAAEKAAPYIHPRLQAIQHTGANGGPIQTEDVSARDVLADRLSRLAPRDGAAEDPGKPH
jgi:hypothetical protein